ncbi:hypothetical protein AB838_21365 [Rhodobacteraceae bacterium (ex Bugula neritina AB1)]|nr:hypothetical protein AB838_21365 [Rhodobacteraceae bacterium (ex Bugula neritina AB1)]
MNEEIYQPGDPVADILFNWSPLIVAALACAFGLFLILLGFRNYVKAALLKKSGVKGHATVTQKWLKKGYVDRDDRHHTKPTKYHYLRYERSNGGKILTEKEVAPIALWKEIEPGDQVEVIYLPGRSMMRLASWPDQIGLSAGLLQLTIGALVTATSAGMMISSALAAMSGPEYRDIGPDWIVDTAEVLNVGIPADPYLRLLAPQKTYVKVVFGDTQGGALMANQRLVLLSPEQFAGHDISEGAILKAWLQPENEYNAVLEIERDLSSH